MIGMIACSTENSNCILHHCDSCANDSSLRFAIESAINFGDNSNSYDNDICVSQWVSTDHTEIRKISFTAKQFVDECMRLIRILTKHSFMAHSQGNYLKQRRVLSDVHSSAFGRLC